MDYIIALGVVIGAADLIFGNRLRLGEKFEEGFLCLGSTALSMVGIICLAPLFGEWIGSVTTPLFHFFGIDPAMTGCVLANNMGGYALANVLADDPRMVNFSGLVVASTLGATVVYTIPVGLRLIEKKQLLSFAKGIMIGLCGVPVGSFLGGIAMGLPLSLLLINMVPIIVFSLLLVLGLFFFRDQMIKGFMIFAKLINVITTVGLSIAAIQYILGITILPGMDSVESAMWIVSEMGIVQLGSIPVAYCLIALLRRPFMKIGKKMRINPVSVASLPVSCVNVVSSFLMTKDMDDKGLIINAAWYTNTIAVFTAHYAFTKAMAPEMITPVLLAKLAGGAAAMLLALYMTRNMKAEEAAE